MKRSKLGNDVDGRIDHCDGCAGHSLRRCVALHEAVVAKAFRKIIPSRAMASIAGVTAGSP